MFMKQAKVKQGVVVKEGHRVNEMQEGGATKQNVGGVVRTYMCTEVGEAKHRALDIRSDEAPAELRSAYALRLQDSRPGAGENGGTSGRCR
jgi:hypothetical protein